LFKLRRDTSLGRVVASYEADRRIVVDLSWIALTAPALTLPALAVAAKWEDAALRGAPAKGTEPESGSTDLPTAA
jgi:hypothetical protein